LGADIVNKEHSGANNIDETDGIGFNELQIFDSVQVTERTYCWTPYIPKRCVSLI